MPFHRLTISFVVVGVMTMLTAIGLSWVMSLMRSGDV